MLFTLLGLIAFVIVAFILLREFNCWYWKINERIKLQKEVVELLKKLEANNDRDQHQRGSMQDL